MRGTNAPRRRAWLALFSIFTVAILAFAGQASAGIDESSPLPAISSDKADYTPGELVTLSGAFWAAGESVHVVVNDDAGQTWRYETDVTAGSDGSFSLQFNLPELFVASYMVTASAPSGTATTSFTDANLKFALATADNAAPSDVTWSVDWDQWQGTGNTANNTCNGTRSSFGTANYSGNTLSSGSEAGINNNASAKPTGADTTGPVADTYELDYWSSSPTSTTPLTSAQLCRAGVNGPTVFTFYAHFKLSDVTAPTTTANASPAANAAGWNKTNVTVDLSSADNTGGSGVKEITYSASGAQTIASITVAGSSVSDISITAEGETTLSFFAKDNAGNTEATKTLVLKIDKTAPVLAAAAVKGTADDFADASSYDENSWTNKDVKVSFSCSDSGGSGVAAGSPSPASQTFKTEGVHSASSSCSDVAGNSANTSFGVKIDKTAPSISFVGQSPAANGAGWNNSDVTLSWSCTDGLSGPVDATVTKQVTSEGTHQQKTGMCNDVAGNEASSTDGDVNLDKTKPVVNVTGVSHGATYTLGSVPTPGCATTDALSDVKTAAALTVTGGPVGSITAACSGAEDNAGNTNSASATYTVNFDWTGFFQPIDNNPDQSGDPAFATVWNSAKAGQAIPVKFSLHGNQGLSIFAAGYPKTLKVTCPSAAPVLDTIETYTASTPGLTYDATADQYNYVWKTTSAVANTCQRLEVKLVDGTSHYAFFKFLR